MRNKSLIIALVMIVIMIMLSGCGEGSSPESKLKGTWKVVSATVDKEATTKDKIVGMRAALVRMIYKDGTTIVFKDQNKVNLVSLNVSSEYKIDGNKLSFKDAQTGQWSSDYFEYEINSGKMTWKFPGLTLNFEKQKQ